jgi:pimeloyl-ACP methyl ester carboxylesterase
LEGLYLKHPDATKAIIILHENIHGMFHQFINALEYQYKYNVLLYYNTGHGSSGGMSSLGIEEAEDFVDVLQWLVGAGNDGIGVYGASLGGEQQR